MHTFQLRHHLHDPELDRLSAYFLKLFIQIGQNSIQYSLLDTEKNKFLSLHDVTLNSPLSADNYPDILNQYFTTVNIHEKKYPAVTIGIESPYQTLVPSPFFENDHLRKYISFHFTVPENFSMYADNLAALDAFNVYAIHPDITGAIRTYFPEAAIFNNQTALLSYFYQNFRLKSSATVVFLHVREKYIDLACFSEPGLRFFNSFPYQSKEDILYYTLNALEQISIRPDQASVAISGLMEQTAEAYHLLNRYIPGISFSERMISADYSAIFHSLPEHFYPSLFSLMLCGS